MQKTIKKKYWFKGILILFLGVILYGGFWFFQSYPPEVLALDALVDSEQVSVSQTKAYILFKPIESNPNQKGLIYYPGAKVTPEAYSVMAHALAMQGIPVVIVKVPFNFAVFDIDKALDIMEVIDLDIKWAIGGHSLGGAMASELVYKNPELFDTLILFASYANKDLSDYTLNVLSIWGTKDAFVTEEKINEKKNLLPKDTIYAKIEGGNHSQFGHYGFQKGDHPATIASELQLNQIVEAVSSILKP